MRNFAIVVVSMLVVLFFFTGGEPETNEDAAATDENTVGPAETFTWQGAQPIRFQPPQGWQAGRWQQGGRNGVDYIKSGQRIAVTEFTRVGALDGCARLQQVLTDLNTKDRRSLQRDLRIAVRHPRDVDNPKEAKLIRDLKEYTVKAEQALAEGDLAKVRHHVDNALRTRWKNPLSLDDYLADVKYNQSVHGDIKRVEISETSDASVGGVKAKRVDYEVDIRAQYATGVLEKTEVGREVYVMSNNRLFVLAFQGKAETMPLFEQVVNSVSFPDGACSL